MTRTKKFLQAAFLNGPTNVHRDELEELGFEEETCQLLVSEVSYPEPNEVLSLPYGRKYVPLLTGQEVLCAQSVVGQSLAGLTH